MVLSDDDLIRLQRKKKEHVDLLQLMMVVMKMRLSMTIVISMQIVVVDVTVVLQVVFAVHDKVTPAVAAVAAVAAVSAADEVCAFACHLFRF